MKKKILFILHYPPPIHGAAMMGKYIKESEIINDNFDCKFINLGTSRTVDEIGKGGLKKWMLYFTILWETFISLIRFKPELVYLTLTAKGLGFYKDAVIALLVKNMGVKVVYHFHNKGVSLKQDCFFDNWLYKKVFKKANVILLSEHLYYDIEKYVSKNQVYFCANGIPILNEKSDKNEVLKNVDSIEILFLSNLIKSKGVFVLLEACSLMKKGGLSFNCVFVGDEGDVSSIQLQQKIDALGLTNQVKYLGKKINEEKKVVFSRADIFVFPSFNECFGLVLLEAMQFSLPVVSTFEGGIPDIVSNGETGFLVPKEDAKALADKLEMLISNPSLRKKFGEAGKIKYEEQFTLPIFEKRVTEILKKIE